MILLHYSRKPLSMTNLYYKEQKEPHTYTKPCGLWVSVQGERDWREWCKCEGFGISQYAHRVKLHDEANILYLKSCADLDKFTKNWGTVIYLTDIYKTTAIDWRKVALSYQGVVIAPYQWRRRMSDHTSWYYGWDCASGCIWDHKAIREIIRVPELDER